MLERSVLRRQFRYSWFNATLYLIAANILFFALSYMYPPLKVYMALTPFAVVSGYIWQPITYMFAHANLSHLFVNMLGLFFFGTQVERRLGSREFLLFYFVTGILAGIASFAIYAATGAWYAMLLGASGALFAVLLAFAVLDPDAMIYIYGVLPVRAPLMVTGYAAIEILSQFFGSGSSVAHLTHLAGFLWAGLYFPLRFGLNPFKRLFGRRSSRR